MACCDTKVLEQALEPSGSRLFHVFNDTLILLSLYVCGLGLFFFLTIPFIFSLAI